MTTDDRGRGGLRLGGGCSEKMLAPLTEAHTHLTRTMGDFGRLLEQITPKVIGLRLVKLDTLGTAADQFRLPFRSLAVDLAPFPVVLPATATAGNNASVTLPAGAYLTGFTLTGGSFTVASFATITITGAVGGTQTYNVQFNNSSTAPIFGMQQQLSEAIAPAGPDGFPSPNGQITVTFTGNVNTPAVSLVAYGSGGPVTVAASPLAELAPGPGVGVAVVRRGGFAVLNMRAYEWSMYGTPGQLATVTAYASPQAPSSAR